MLVKLVGTSFKPADIMLASQLHFSANNEVQNTVDKRCADNKVRSVEFLSSVVGPSVHDNKILRTTLQEQTKMQQLVTFQSKNVLHCVQYPLKLYYYFFLSLSYEINVSLTFPMVPQHKNSIYSIWSTFLMQKLHSF